MKAVPPASKTRIRSRLGVLGGLALAAGALILLAQITGGPPDRLKQLRALPEAQLLYPGSQVLARGGRDATVTVDGPLSAASWQLVGVDAHPDEIEAWYSAQLSQRGWTLGGGSSGIRSVEEQLVRAWSRNGVIFRLGIRDPDYWGADPELFARFQSVYDAAMLGDRDRRATR